ncbi:MAG: hypothetical protein AAB116_15545, partial [Candidatus Poribacteria bacterium]
MRAVEEKVSTLERVLEEFIIHTEASQSRLEESRINTDIALTRLERGLEDFKEEMSEFKDRMEASHKEINKQWAALAKKMGTVDE